MTKSGDKIHVCTNARSGYGPRIGRRAVTVVMGFQFGVIYRNRRGVFSLAKSWVRIK